MSGVGLALKQARRAAGLAQQQLADELGIAPQFLSEIERGKRRLPKDRLERLPEPIRRAVVVEMVVQHNDRGRWLEALLNGEGK